MGCVEFYFDCSSPWTYLAFHRIQVMAREAGAEIVWKPILVGGVFNAVNQGLYEQRSRLATAVGEDDRSGAGRKARYYMKDLADWARFTGLRIGQPQVFPVNSVRAMRACLFADDRGMLVPFATRVFAAYWGDLRDISQPDVLREVAGAAGLDADATLEAAAAPAFKERLRANTDEVIERGGFGSPTMFVGDEMYFGNDRLELVRAALLAGA